MTSDFKKIIMNTHLIYLQHFLPNGGQGLLCFC